MGDCRHRPLPAALQCCHPPGLLHRTHSIKAAYGKESGRNTVNQNARRRGSAGEGRFLWVVTVQGGGGTECEVYNVAALAGAAYVAANAPRTSPHCHIATPVNSTAPGSTCPLAMGSTQAPGLRDSRSCTCRSARSCGMKGREETGRGQRKLHLPIGKVLRNEGQQRR